MLIAGFHSSSHKKASVAQKQLALIGFLGIIIVTYVGLWQTNHGQYISEQFKTSSKPEEVNLKIFEDFVEENVYCGENNQVCCIHLNQVLAR